jgi:hypothetical protein
MFHVVVTSPHRNVAPTAPVGIDVTNEYLGAGDIDLLVERVDRDRGGPTLGLHDPVLHAGRDRNVFLPTQRVRDHASSNRPAGLVFEEYFTGGAIEGEQISRQIAGENQAAGGRQKAGNKR